ncbi:MAG: hypothetical protein ABI640_05095 [Gammaproteobacteria bacterium]
MCPTFLAAYRVGVLPRMTTFADFFSDAARLHSTGLEGQAMLDRAMLQHG